MTVAAHNFDSRRLGPMRMTFTGQSFISFTQKEIVLTTDMDDGVEPMYNH